MKYQALFPSNDTSRKIKYRLLQFLLGALRVKSSLLWAETMCNTVILCSFHVCL